VGGKPHRKTSHSVDLLSYALSFGGKEEEKLVSQEKQWAKQGSETRKE